MAKITKKTNLGKLVSQNHEVARVLAEDYGLHCVGCMAARFDTLEQGMKIHNYDDKEIVEIIKKLNKMVNK